MYEQFFGLREPAFSLTPDPRFLWPSETHQEGLSALVYGIVRRKGFILLTGEVGSGKTTLLRAALDQMPRGTEVALVMNTSELRPLDLFKLIAQELRLEGRYDSKVDYIIALNTFLLSQLQAGIADPGIPRRRVATRSRSKGTPFCALTSRKRARVKSRAGGKRVRAARPSARPSTP